jgi:hypothetical protein
MSGRLAKALFWGTALLILYAAILAYSVSPPSEKSSPGAG